MEVSIAYVNLHRSQFAEAIHMLHQFAEVAYVKIENKSQTNKKHTGIRDLEALQHLQPTGTGIHQTQASFSIKIYVCQDKLSTVEY